MSKVYMQADENEAGVTVEELPGSPSLISIQIPESEPALASDLEARAVVEGLLRRMLEREGPGAVDSLVHSIVAPYMRARNDPREGR